MPTHYPRTVVASAARTTSDNSGAIVAGSDVRTMVDEGQHLTLLVDVTAVTGTSPTLDVTVEWSHDGTNFAAAETSDAFAQITAAKKTIERFDLKAPFYRVVWTLGGTNPSFTFSVSEYLT